MQGLKKKGKESGLVTNPCDRTASVNWSGEVDYDSVPQITTQLLKER